MDDRLNFIHTYFGNARNSALRMDEEAAVVNEELKSALQAAGIDIGADTATADAYLDEMPGLDPSRVKFTPPVTGDPLTMIIGTIAQLAVMGAVRTPQFQEFLKSRKVARLLKMEARRIAHVEKWRELQESIAGDSFACVQRALAESDVVGTADGDLVAVAALADEICGERPEASALRASWNHVVRGIMSGATDETIAARTV
jgi:hypothetical protein